jgi:hypothetical protein
MMGFRSSLEPFSAVRQLGTPAALHRASTPAGAAWRRLTMIAVENVRSKDSEFEIRAVIV